MSFEQLNPELDKQYRISNVNVSISLTDIGEKIKSQLEENFGFDVAYSLEDYTTGSFFNKTTEQILDLCNPHHRDDYIHRKIRVKQVGKAAIITVIKTGESKNYKTANSTSVFGGAKRLLGGSVFKESLEDESIYDDALDSIIDTVIKG